MFKTSLKAPLAGVALFELLGVFAVHSLAGTTGREFLRGCMNPHAEGLLDLTALALLSLIAVYLTTLLMCVLGIKLHKFKDGAPHLWRDISVFAIGLPLVSWILLAVLNHPFLGGSQ